MRAERMNDIIVDILHMRSIPIPIFHFKFTWITFVRYIFMISTIISKLPHSIWKFSLTFNSADSLVLNIPAI